MGVPNVVLVKKKKHPYIWQHAATLSYSPLMLNVAVTNDPCHVTQAGGYKTAATFLKPGKLPDNGTKSTAPRHLVQTEERMNINVFNHQSALCSQSIHLTPACIPANPFSKIYLHWQVSEQCQWIFLDCRRTLKHPEGIHTNKQIDKLLCFVLCFFEVEVEVVLTRNRVRMGGVLPDPVI